MAADHWFEDLADHMGPAYLRYSFTKGTGQEVAFLVEELGLEPGMRVLDVGCGPGRHVNALAALGIETVGLDISQRFVDVGASAGVDGATFVRGDARAMAFDEEFDAAISLCQGAFGLGGPPQSLDPFNLDNDAAVLAGIWRALRPGGRAALTAFSAYFQVRWLEDHDRFDAATAVEIGLVTVAAGTAEDLNAALSGFVEDLRKGSPQGLAASKALTTASILAAFDRDAHRLATESARLFTTAEAHEGMLAFLQKRPPEWALPAGD